MKRILVPVDFSENSDYVANYALGVAEIISGEITFYHVYLDPTLGAPVPSYDFGTYKETYTGIIGDAEKLEIQNLETFHNKFQRHLIKKGIENVKLNYTLESGFPEEEILIHASRTGTDLIAIGTRGKGGLMRELFGSVTEKVVEEAEIPVLVVPEKSKFTGLNSILYATDYRESDLLAITKLAKIFAGFDVTINCVHVCFGQKERKDLVEMVKLRQKLKEEFGKLKVECTIIESQDIIHGFEEFLKQKKIDIIAMTTHKRNVFTKYLNPSFTKKFIFQTKLPLLVFHG